MATRFVTSNTSINSALNKLADISNLNTAAAVSNATTTTLAMTAAQLLSGMFVNAANGALTINFPTAADIIAAIPNAQVGSQVVLFFRNDGDNTVTFGVSGSTGVTLSGTATVATTLGAVLVAKVTAATTVTVFVVLKVAN